MVERAHNLRHAGRATVGFSLIGMAGSPTNLTSVGILADHDDAVTEVLLAVTSQL